MDILDTTTKYELPPCEGSAPSHNCHNHRSLPGDQPHIKPSLPLKVSRHVPEALDTPHHCQWCSRCRYPGNLYQSSLIHEFTVPRMPRFPGKNGLFSSPGPRQHARNPGSHREDPHQSGPSAARGTPTDSF